MVATQTQSDQEVFDARKALAIKRCQENIDYYSKFTSIDAFCHHLFLALSILLSGLTPVLILWTDLPKAVQALPAALGAVAAGLPGVFHWREDWIRFGYTSELLKSELNKFETRSTKTYSLRLGQEVALDHFVQRTEKIILSETSEWRTQVLETATDDDEAN